MKEIPIGYDDETIVPRSHLLALIEQVEKLLSQSSQISPDQFREKANSLMQRMIESAEQVHASTGHLVECLGLLERGAFHSVEKQKLLEHLAELKKQLA